jgi:hypothetical protein
MQIARWPSLVLRGFGIANFIFAGLGLLLLASSVFDIRQSAAANTPQYPYFLLAFWTMTAANLVLLALLIFGGIRLVQLNSSGVSVCNAAFAAEIAYFAMVGILWGAASHPSISKSVGAATGVGSIGLSPQMICGYPLIALIFLNLARQRLPTIMRISNPDA